MTTHKFVLGRKFQPHHYNKDDVQRHTSGYYGYRYPAVNVKVWHFVSSDKIADKFGCSEDTALKAAEYAFNAACETFWQEVQDTAEECFGRGVKAYSAGHSGGWLIIQGLTDVEEWDAVMLAKWRHFEKIIKADVSYRTSEDVILEDIEANRWAEDGAEAYNYVEFKDGHSECIVDLKREEAQSD